MAIHRYHPPDPECPFCIGESGAHGPPVLQQQAFTSVRKAMRANTILALFVTVATAVKFASE